MLVDNKPLFRRLIVLGGLIVILFICLAILNLRTNDFALEQNQPSFNPILINPEILQNWLPPSSYKDTLSLVDNYLQNNNLLVDYMSVQGGVVINPATLGTYDFDLVLEPQNQTLKISVAIDNFSGIISTSISINGQKQDYSVPKQSSSGTQLSNFSSLTSVGVTTLQAEELQAALQTFAPNASTVTINAASLVLPVLNPNSPSLTHSYGFTVNIDGVDYEAKLNCIVLNEIELYLTDIKSGKQVFDSGIISQS